MPTERSANGCCMKFYPGMLVQYTKPGSSCNGNIYLVAVRCRGKKPGLTPESCTFPVLIDIKSGYARKGTSTPPKHPFARDWRKYGAPVTDVVGSAKAGFYKAITLYACNTAASGITLGR